VQSICVIESSSASRHHRGHGNTRASTVRPPGQHGGHAVSASEDPRDSCGIDVRWHRVEPQHRELMDELATCHYLDTATDVLLIGPPGLGRNTPGRRAGQGGSRDTATRTNVTTAPTSPPAAPRRDRRQVGPAMRFCAGPTPLVLDLCRDCPANGVAGPTRRSMVGRKAGRDDRDTGGHGIAEEGRGDNHRQRVADERSFTWSGSASPAMLRCSTWMLGYGTCAMTPRE
jgi:hypothetical protein